MSDEKIIYFDPYGKIHKISKEDAKIRTIDEKYNQIHERHYSLCSTYQEPPFYVEIIEQLEEEFGEEYSHEYITYLQKFMQIIN